MSAQKRFLLEFLQHGYSTAWVMSHIKFLPFPLPFQQLAFAINTCRNSPVPLQPLPVPCDSAIDPEQDFVRILFRNNIPAYEQ